MAATGTSVVLIREAGDQTLYGTKAQSLAAGRGGIPRT